MRISVAVVEPMYQINLGHIARAMKNFGAHKLYLINPRCNHNGRESLKYAKHATDILKSAKIIDSVKKLPRTDLLIGSTGIWHKSEASYYNIYPLKGIGKILSNKKNQSIMILLGRDGTGLTKEEMRECDASIHIPASKEYPILNISHALAVMLYELTRSSAGNHEIDKFSANEAQLAGTIRLFRKLAESNKSIRDKAGVSRAFEHMLKRASPTSKELNAISIALSTNMKRKRNRRQTS